MLYDNAILTTFWPFHVSNMNPNATFVYFFIFISTFRNRMQAGRLLRLALVVSACGLEMIASI